MSLCTTVVYFDQVLSAMCTQKLVEILIVAFYRCFSYFYIFFLCSDWKQRKAVEKTVFKLPLIASQHPNAGWFPEGVRIFSPSVIFLFIWFSNYSVLWIQSTIPARLFNCPGCSCLTSGFPQLLSLISSFAILGAETGLAIFGITILGTIYLIWRIIL